MVNSSMRVLSAVDAMKEFCSEAKRAARDCGLKNNVDSIDNSKRTDDCSPYRRTAKKCENVVQNAFRYINMGGCPKQIKLLTVCEDDWCRHRDPPSCNRECAGVRNDVRLCVQEIVLRYLKRNGLK